LIVSLRKDEFFCQANGYKGEEIRVIELASTEEDDQFFLIVSLRKDEFLFFLIVSLRKGEFLSSS